MIVSPPLTWNIGLSAWIIQDGNYPDFAVGQTVEFAVEFYQQPATAIEVCKSEVVASQATGNSYSVVAEKVLVTDAVTVLDIGILVYREGTSEFSNVERGDRIRTELELSVDPYFYFESLSSDESIPPLIYSWRITSILRQTAPFIEVASGSGGHRGAKMMARDVSKLGYAQILKTDAWQDDNGFGEYILRCDLLPIPAKRVSITAT
jgi:hypothetical protein